MAFDSRQRGGRRGVVVGAGRRAPHAPAQPPLLTDAALRLEQRSMSKFTKINHRGSILQEASGAALECSQREAGEPAGVPGGGASRRTR